MTANKMPEMPEAVEQDIRHMEADGWRYVRQYIATAHQIGYLAGLEAAKACVPAQRFRDEHDDDIEWASVGGHNDCRNKTLTNLTALEQEAKK